MALARNKARIAINAGLVQVNSLIATDVNQTITAGTELQLNLSQGIPSKGGLKARNTGTLRSKSSAGSSFRILYEDEDVVVVDKASGILSAPTEEGSRGHVPELLRQHWRQRNQPHQYIGVVHRIDQATSGCLLFTRNKHAQSILGFNLAPLLNVDISPWLVANRDKMRIPSIINLAAVRMVAAASWLTISLANVRSPTLRLDNALPTVLN